MRLSTCTYAAAFGGALLASTTTAQVLTTLPACLQSCVNNFDSSCGTAELTCVCGLAAQTSFLSDVLTCYKSTCGGGPDFDIVLAALQPACLLVEKAIPASVISYVQSVEVASYPTQTLIPGGGVTTTDGGVVGILPTVSAVTTTDGDNEGGDDGDGGRYVTTTLVGIYASGSVTETVAVPEVYNSATTMYGNPVIVYPSGQHTVVSPVPLGGSTSTSTPSLTTTTVTVVATDSTLSFVGTLSPSSISVAPVTGVTLATTPSASVTSSSGSGSGGATPFSGSSKTGGSMALGLVLGAVLGGTLLL